MVKQQKQRMALGSHFGKLGLWSKNIYVSNCKSNSAIIVCLCFLNHSWSTRVKEENCAVQNCLASPKKWEEEFHSLYIVLQCGMVRTGIGVASNVIESPQKKDSNCATQL